MSKKSRSPALYHKLAGVSRGDEYDPHRLLVDNATALVDAGLDLLHHIEDNGQLRFRSALIPGGTLGKHFRHVCETFDALLLPLGVYTDCDETAGLRGAGEQAAGLLSGGKDHKNVSQASQDAIVVDYDVLLPASRQRIARDLETCRAALQRVREGLHALGGAENLPASMSRTVEVVAVTPARQTMRSTVGRELWFCALHAIHHYTMVRTIAVHELGIPLPIEFGTAPATLLLRAPDWKPPAPPGQFKAKL